MSGQPNYSVKLREMTNDIYENKMKNDEYLAIGLGNVAQQQLAIGALRDAERNLRRSIDLSSEIAEAVGHQELGRVLSCSGEWNNSEQELETAEKLFTKEKSVQSLSIIWSHRALRFLLMARSNPQSSIVNLKSSIECAQRAIELADETAKTIFTHPRDYVRAHWLLGAAYRANHDLTLAEENLSKAINLCRQINLVEMEANIVLDFARLRYDQKDYEEAKSLAEEALSITERCGYVLQGADVNLFLAQYALEQENDKAKAKEYAESALKLAYCDGPPYYYKVAYEEAERFLANLK